MTNLFYPHSIYNSIVPPLVDWLGITCAVPKLNMGGGLGLGFLLREDRRRECFCERGRFDRCAIVRLGFGMLLSAQGMQAEQAGDIAS